jgi:hypothetical protein
MKEAIEQFRTELGAAIDSVEFVKKALDTQAPETDGAEGPDRVRRRMPTHGAGGGVADTAVSKAASRRQT